MPLTNSKRFLVVSRDLSQLLEKKSTSSSVNETSFLWQAKNLSMQRTIKTGFHLSLPCGDRKTVIFRQLS